jgi:hypothetical protein
MNKTVEVEDKSSITFEEGLGLLLEEQKVNSKPTHENPKALPLNKIRMAHSVFQPRQFENGTMGNSEDHIRNLMDAIRNEPSNTLDPITVWWSGEEWRVIDGHHRTLAYSRVVKANPKLKGLMIPVIVYKGTLWEALAEATRLNSKDKLPMNKSDKYNRAWKLTVLEQYSKNSLAMICKVSTTTISRMRNVYSEMQKKTPQQCKKYSLGLTWEEAQKYGQEDRVIDDEWERKMALEWSKRLGRAFGTKAATQPNIFAKAIGLYSENLENNLMEWYKLTPEGLVEDY